MNRAFSPLFAAVFVAVASAGSNSNVFAQTAPAMPLVPELKAMPAEPTSWRPIAVKNLPPRTLAEWLDPAHNRKSTATKFPAIFGIDAATKPQGKDSLFALPTGVEAISPIDAQNILLVLGTEAGTKNLESIVAFLDKPQRQVEVDVHVVEMDPENYKAMGLEFSVIQGNAKGATPTLLTFVRGNFLGQLEKLKGQNKARIVSTPRVIAINNQAANLTTTYSQPTVLAFKDEKGNYNELSDEASKKNGLGLSMGREFKFAVTPTVNNDDTITLLLAPTTSLVLTSDNSSESLVLKNLHAMQSVANVRDGDTLALTGFTSQDLPTSEAAKAFSSNVVLFVTPRIIRRMGDAEVQAATLTR